MISEQTSFMTFIIERGPLCATGAPSRYLQAPFSNPRAANTAHACFSCTRFRVLELAAWVSHHNVVTTLQTIK